MKLDEKGRCCGRVPIRKDRALYWPDAPFYFCAWCHREYGIDGTQRQNWAWRMNAAGEYDRRNRSLSDET